MHRISGTYFRLTTITNYLLERYDQSTVKDILYPLGPNVFHDIIYIDASELRDVMKDMLSMSDYIQLECKCTMYAELY